MHAFRHSFAKQYIKNGGDVFRLQQLMTHADIATTKKYVNMFGEELKDGYEMYNQLDTLLNKNKTNHMSMNKR